MGEGGECVPGTVEETRMECQLRDHDEGMQECERTCTNWCEWGNWQCGFCARF
jgi:hypothetical protein